MQSLEIETTTIVLPEGDHEKLYSLAKGDYQTALLMGRENWSGSSLRGSAKHQWGGSYARSRSALIARMRQAGYEAKYVYDRYQHGKKCLVVWQA